jgi:hypothetical protein
MKVNRAEFLELLESVSPGVSDKADTEQSDCFAFVDDYVVTFNDEVACRRKCEYGLQGAVRASSLLEMLRRGSSSTVSVEVVEGEFRLSAKGERTGLTLEQKVDMPVEYLDKPTSWKKLPDGFRDAVEIVKLCASDDQMDLALSCIHIHPEYLEACDNFSLIRYPIATGVKESICVPAKSLSAVLRWSASKISVTDSWVHFKGEHDVVSSCRRFMEQYPDLSDTLNVKGSAIELPEGLDKTLSRAAVLAEESVKVSIRDGQMRVRGESDRGWYERRETVKSDKSLKLEFMIAPKLMTEICQRFSKCEVGEGRLKADNGKFVFVAVTGLED